MKLKAIKVNNQNNKKCEMYLCSIKVSDLIDGHQIKVDLWREEKISGKNQGYQRSEDRAHVKKIIKSILNNGIDFPTSILLSYRKSGEKMPKFEYDDKKSLIEINEFPIYLVDGQHRTAGIREALIELEKTNEKIKDLEIGAVLLVGLDKYQEMEYFEIINTTSKKVKTELARELLFERVKKMPNNDLRSNKDKDWVVRGLSIIHELNKRDDSPWFCRIKMPNKIYNKSENVVAGEGQLLASLKVALESPNIRIKKLDEVINIFDEYWKAIRELFPDAFLHPKKHVIQKTNGFFPLHMIFPQVMAKLLEQRKEINKNNFKNILKLIFENVSDIDGFGSENENSKFWQSGKRDGAAMYRGQAGFKSLYDLFEESLDDLE